MTYESFAYYYDELMTDVPYDKWIELIKDKKEQYRIEGNQFLDLACGTGELSIRLAEAGFNVTGVDLSSEMLTIAQSKAEKSGYKIHFYQQNMVELELAEKYDLIGIFCDSLNYLLTPEEVKETFQRVNRFLKAGGLYFFDVHSLFKIREIFMDQTFTYDDDSICYIWNCFPGKAPDSVEHELTFFVEDELGKYDRFDENHTQRTFSIETYQNWLDEAGFELLEVTGDFENIPPNEYAERIFFIARKK